MEKKNVKHTKKRTPSRQKSSVNKRRKSTSQSKRIVPKKKKRSYKRLKKMCIIFILLIILCTLVAKRNSIALWRKGYSYKEREILLKVDKEELKDYIHHDSVLDILDWNEYANNGHFYDYIYYQSLYPGQSYEQVIQSVDKFYDAYPSLKILGYSKEFCRERMNIYSIDDFVYLSQTDFTYEQTSPYFKINGCQITDLEQYINSGSKPKEAILSITYPFIDSRSETVVSYSIIDPKKKTTLIKSGFTLNDYVPDNLVQVNLPLQELDSAYLREDAAKALINMYNDAQKEGLTIGIRSAYRSYTDQEAVYNEYVNMYGLAYASQLVSIPGSSEHQLGLGVDLTSQSVIDGVHGSFDQSAEYTWVMEHCHEYGFILRYPEDKTELTGAMNEPWHFRYVGTKAAKEMKTNGWTLEEYTLNHGLSSNVRRN